VITVQVDSFEHSIPELRELFPTHHRELALFQDRMPLVPDYAEYVRREREGSLFLTTARWNGRVVAYYVAQVRLGFHYSTTLTGTMDILYVVPEFRNRGLALPLFRHTEKELKRRGVSVWYSGYKTRNQMGLAGLHEVLGFQPADTYVAKWIGD